MPNMLNDSKARKQFDKFKNSHTTIAFYLNYYPPGIDLVRSCQVEKLSPVQCAVYLPLPAKVDLDKIKARFPVISSIDLQDHFFKKIFLKCIMHVKIEPKINKNPLYGDIRLTYSV